jgi:hypothetical protein
MVYDQHDYGLAEEANDYCPLPPPLTQVRPALS